MQPTTSDFQTMECPECHAKPGQSCISLPRSRNRFYGGQVIARKTAHRERRWNWFAAHPTTAKGAPTE